MKTLLRDAVAVAVVSGLVFQALRQWVGEHYVVPSNSMQPALYGASERGDVVFVDKLAAVSSLRRYDLAVFRVPGEAADLVKRVVAFGNEWVEPRDGDLWIGPAKLQVERAVKDPLEFRDLRVPWWEWRAGAELVDEFVCAPPDPRGLALHPVAGLADARRVGKADVRRAMAASPAGPCASGPWISTRRAVDTSYLDVLGNRGNARSDVAVTDLGVDFEFAPAGVEGLLCGIELRPEGWMLYWNLARGAVELWRNGDPVAQHQLPPGLAASGRSSPVRVEYGHLDGRFFFAVDGRRDCLWCVDPLSEGNVSDPGPAAMPLPKNRLFLAVIGATAAPIGHLTVFRDVYWFRPKLEIGADPARFVAAKFVPTGNVYLLGDNSTDSRDSRMFGPVPIAGFVGRPRAVLGPWPRTRWLPR